MSGLSSLTWNLIDALADAGLEADVVGTGGNCRAIEVKVSDDLYLLITNGDADIPDQADEGDREIYVAIYRHGEDDEALDETGIREVGESVSAFAGEMREWADRFRKPTAAPTVSVEAGDNEVTVRLGDRVEVVSFDPAPTWPSRSEMEQMVGSAVMRLLDPEWEVE